MPPKKGVPWYESLRPKPFDKFMADIKKALSKKVGKETDPDWATYTSLMDKPENAEFKNMRDASGKTAEDYGFDAYISGVRTAMAMEPPKWDYYTDMVEYIPEFKDKRDSAGKTGEDYVFEMFIAVVQILLKADPPRLDLYKNMVEQLPQLKDRKDRTGKSAADYAFDAFIGDIVTILTRENDFETPEWEAYIDLLNDFPEFKDKKDDTGKSAVDYGMEVLVKMIQDHEDDSRYGVLLEEMPEFFNLKDANGKTPVMYAAEAGESDYMLRMIESRGVDPRIKDNAGKTVYQYYEEFLNNETANVNESYKNDPRSLQRELGEINSNRAFFLKAIKDKQAELVARAVAPLAAVSTGISGIGGPIPAVGEIASFLTGERGDPGAQRRAAREQLGRGRKTRKLRIKNKNGKKSRRRV